MNDQQQKKFLIDMLRVMIRELLAYRTFCEKAKQDTGPVGIQEIDRYLNLTRNDKAVTTNLGPDFAVFVEGILLGPERDAGQALDAFLREWFPRSDVN